MSRNLEGHHENSVCHQNTKSNIETAVANHQWSNMVWKKSHTSFAHELDKKISDHDQIAETHERFADEMKKVTLCQAIIGCPSLLDAELFDRKHARLCWNMSVC